MITQRPAAERGHANHGWLDSWHSFSFADYYDPAHMGFGALRVINEDRVAPGKGFGTHGHRDMEIVSYVLDGELRHQDSMGNGSTIVPGDIQRMSAGSGIRHSEFNPSGERPVHFLQIWIEPDVSGIAPSYEQTRVDDAGKRDVFRLIAAPEGGDGAVKLHRDARIYAGLFDGAATLVHAIAPGRKAYVHVARGRATVNGRELVAGDALQFSDEPAVEVTDAAAAEILLFDLD